MRAICCPSCGTIKPTPPDDAARGIFTRYERGQVVYDMSCDYCGRELRKGDPAVALTSPKDLMPGWEQGYIEAEGKR